MHFQRCKTAWLCNSPLAPSNDHHSPARLSAMEVEHVVSFWYPSATSFTFFSIHSIGILPCRKPRHPRPRITDNGRINRALRIACRYWFPPFLPSRRTEKKNCEGFQSKSQLNTCAIQQKGGEWERGEGIDWLSAGPGRRWRRRKRRGERIKLIATETHNARTEL